MPSLPQSSRVQSTSVLLLVLQFLSKDDLLRLQLVHSAFYTWLVPVCWTRWSAAGPDGNEGGQIQKCSKIPSGVCKIRREGRGALWLKGRFLYTISESNGLKWAKREIMDGDELSKLWCTWIEYGTRIVNWDAKRYFICGGFDKRASI